MRRQSSLWRLALATVGLLVLTAAVSAQTPTTELRLSNDFVFATDGVLEPNPPALIGNLPVLFVHGHGRNDEATNPNYVKNWQDPLRPSFKQALEANSGLGIEPYYIRFFDQDRSITEDARDIGEAIELILRRHDPNYPAQPASVQVVIIAYSKGTISTRQYLKSLQVQVEDLPAPRIGFRPVSEFIAISPPNHGIETTLFATTTSLAVKQLYNGYRPQGVLFNCGASFNTAAATDYIENLNGHDIEHTEALDVCEFYPSEAPGSRSPTAPPTDGILYITLFDDQNADFVGGDEASADCQGRRLARNMAPDAINIEVPQIVGNDPATVHDNTVHTPEVICLALDAAVRHRSPVGQTCTLVGSAPAAVPVIPPPTRAAVMLALDFSGSMSVPACPGCASRAIVLQDAVEEFVRLWMQFSEPSDRIGVTYFRTNVAQFSINGGMPLLSAEAENVIDAVGDQVPGDWTAMGGGLQRAIEALNGVPANTRRVILFTDGIQNVNPMVQNVNPTVPTLQCQFIDNEPARQASSGVPPAVPPTVLNGSLGISIDTIGIGAGQAFVGPLEEIANATGGRTWITMAPAAEVPQIFIEELVNALQGFSPQLVAYRRGAVAAKGSTEAFVIEDGVRKLVLKVSWKRGESIDFTVSKDGVDVTSAGRVTNGAFYKIFAIDFPAKGPIAARGNWQVRINGKAATTYEAAAIVDGGHINYDASFGAKRPKAGDPLDLVVRLTAGGRPIAGNPRVTVTLMSPTSTPGDIIARNPPKDLPVFEPGMTVAERQLLALTLDPRTSAALKPAQEKLVLQPNNKGEFRAQLHPKVPGIYTALVNIDGEGSGTGQFSRTLTATTVVRFANADLKGSNIFLTECLDVGGRRYVRLVLRPRDGGGHYLGPGSPSAISLGLSTGRTVGGVRDLGEGGYMLLLEMARSDDPIITLQVAGGAFFTGPLSQLSRMSRP